MAGLNSSQLDAIIRLANTGLAGRELREALSERHGIVLGRNQIGGLLYRLRAKGLVTVQADKIRTNRQRKFARPVGPPVSVRHPVKYAHASGASARFAPSLPSLAEAAPSFSPDLPALEPIVSRGPAAFFDLQRDSCRWPLWGYGERATPDKLFCNEAFHGEGPYCCAHTRASRNRHDHPSSVRNAAYVKKAYLD